MSFLSRRNGVAVSRTCLAEEKEAKIFAQELALL
jgi:hypothetical protein